MTMRRNVFSIVVCLLAWILSNGPAGAQTSDPASASPRGPEIKTYRGIPYVSGGVGEDVRDALKTEAGHFNLQLTFATNTGHYVADANVSVQSEDGQEVLRAASEGPLLYAKLPPGRYTVTAEANGKAQQKQAQVREEGMTELQFHWAE